jgi:hypothetical protein
MSRKSLVKLVALALLPLVLGVSGGSPSEPGYRFTMDAGSHADTIVGWMLGNTLAKADETVTRSPATLDQDLSYFSLVGRWLRAGTSAGEIASGHPARAAAGAQDLASLEAQIDALRPEVERSLQQQIAEALERAGLGRPVAGRDFLFPPVLFRFEEPPYLLVVSPRDRIELTATVLLQPDLTLTEAEQLEDTVGRQGYSALVTPIGGLGVYPSMVPPSSDIRWTLRTVAHEWAHQFFAFRPLGWRYAFGSETDDRMVAVNETAADILGREIGDTVFQQYYQQPGQEVPPASAQDDTFRRKMRDIRTRVDALLGQGKVDEAESFMEASREELAKEGYFLRKLNQAYFAFHGSYSDQLSLGGAQGDEVGNLLHSLRDRSASLGDFAWKVSSIGSYDDLRRLTAGP